jgi:hypothetical protein
MIVANRRLVGRFDSPVATDANLLLDPLGVAYWTRTPNKLPKIRSVTALKDRLFAVLSRSQNTAVEKGQLSQTITRPTYHIHAAERREV